MGSATTRRHLPTRDRLDEEMAVRAHGFHRPAIGSAASAQPSRRRSCLRFPAHLDGASQRHRLLHSRRLRPTVGSRRHFARGSELCRLDYNPRRCLRPCPSAKPQSAPNRWPANIHALVESGGREVHHHAGKVLLSWPGALTGFTLQELRPCQRAHGRPPPTVPPLPGTTVRGSCRTPPPCRRTAPCWSRRTPN